MKPLIKSIEIKRFRSFDSETIGTRQLNIFSGKNNSGKSNILKALNLFFNGVTNYDAPYNYDLDYNKTFTGTAGGRWEITIKINFFGTGDSALKDDFSITKTFGADNTVSGPQYSSSNPDTQAELDKKKSNGNTVRQFTRFLNKIEYVYIPAIRDKKFISNLLLRFEELIQSEARSTEFNDAINQLSDILKNTSEGISDSFEKYIGLPAKAQLSARAADVLGAVKINIFPGAQFKRKRSNGNKNPIENIPIDLFSSGDGVVMAYLVYFLSYLTKKSKNKNFIWGYEEPENSLEYAKVQKLAEEFYNNFSHDAQIFITSHSPAFTGLKDRKDVALYRVYVQPQAESNIGKLPDRRSSKVSTLEDIKNRQLNFFGDENIYNTLNEELHLVEMSTKCEEAAREASSYYAEFKRQKEELEGMLADAKDLFPSKIFICEDEKGKNIWQVLFEKFGISGVTIIPSDGFANDKVENWITIQKTRKEGYSPSVFRETDRDGLSDEQLVELVAAYNERFGKKMRYWYSVLPVCEIENFAIINDQQILNEIAKPTVLDDMSNEFILTAMNRIECAAKVCRESQLFPTKKDEETCKVLELKSVAIQDPTRLMPGKELLKLLENESFRTRVLDLDMDHWPQELKEYLAEIKAFFDKTTPPTL